MNHRLNIGLPGALLLAFGGGGWVLAAWDAGTLVAWMCIMLGSSLCVAQGITAPRIGARRLT